MSQQSFWYLAKHSTQAEVELTLNQPGQLCKLAIAQLQMSAQDPLGL